MGNTQAPGHINYAVKTAEPPYPDASPIYRCAQYPDALVTSMPDCHWENPYDCLRWVVEKRPDFKFLGSRVWSESEQCCRADLKAQDTIGWLTGKEVQELALSLAYGMEKMGWVQATEFPNEQYEPAKRLRMLGIVSKNRPEWFITEHAAAAANYCLVPLYDSLGTDALHHVLGQSQMAVLVASAESFRALFPALLSCSGNKHDSARRSNLRHLILFDWPDDKMHTMAAELGVEVHYWKDVVTIGRECAPKNPGDDSGFRTSSAGFSSAESSAEGAVRLSRQVGRDVTTVCYTSGTTGVPKGVLITAHNFVSMLCGHQRCIMSHPGFRTTTEDIHISYLPLAHVFERMICANCLVLGVRIVCYSGDTQKLLEDMKVIQPTIFLSVPRLFMRISDKIQTTLNEKSTLARFIFSKALDAKLKNLREKGIYHHPVWDQLVFRKTRALLGGRVKFMLVGGAPVEAIVQEKISVIFCCPLLHGFGMTEVGAVFICNPGENIAGHIGGVQPCLEFCLRSVPENGYYVGGSNRSSEDGHPASPSYAQTRANTCRGELCLRGESVCPGYLELPKETSDVIDENGWFYTGDVAELLPDAGNAVKIIDRKKNIFKLSQGEYVAPEKLENIYSSAALVGQILVYGDSTKSQLVAIVVPDVEEGMKWAKSNAPDIQDLDSLCVSPAFKDAVLASFREVEKINDVIGFQKVKNIALHPREFSIENGLLTPTLKLRRNECKNRFKEVLAELYKEL